MTFAFLGIFVFCLLLGTILTYCVRNLANAKGWVPVSIDQRDVHKSPVPRLGGIAIFTCFTLSLALSYAASWHYPFLQDCFPARPVLIVLLSASLVFLLGLYDDLRGASPYAKFAVQGLAATMLFVGGLRITNIPVLFGGRALPWLLGWVCTVIWVLALTNAFNLIDGLDGLAAGSALFSTLVTFVVALQNGSSMVTVMAIALAGALVGFLRYNFNPATIFLGDSGSLFVGFLLSALALRGVQKSPTVVAIAIPLVSFGLPVLETSLSVLRRFIGRRPIFVADRQHIHHRLLDYGLSHRQAVTLLYGVSAGFALLSLFMLWPKGGSLGLVLAVLGSGIWIGVQHLRYPEFGELARIAQRTLDQRQILVNNLFFRRAAEDLKTAHSYEQIRRILLHAFESNDFDGFDVLVAESPIDPSHFPAMVKPAGWSASAPLFWRKAGMPMATSDLHLWTLSVNLLSTSSKPQGTLRTHRVYSDLPIQLDINLVISGFPVALADALERAAAQKGQVLVMHDPGTQAVAAPAS